MPRVRPWEARNDRSKDMRSSVERLVHMTQKRGGSAYAYHHACPAAALLSAPGNRGSWLVSWQGR